MLEKAVFDKSVELFPVKSEYIFLSHCGVSPFFSGGLARMNEIAGIQTRAGSLIFAQYDALLNSLRQAAAELMRTAPENVAFVKNTSEGIGMIAGGYPFEPGDQVITWVHEYPANYYPWKLQERRGVEVVELPNRDIDGLVPAGLPGGWTMDDLERAVTPRTRIVSLSQVQFTSGFGCDVAAVGRFCAARGIDLVVDVAQSLGSLPVYPEEQHIGALASAGWKWLLGPLGCGLMYVSPAMRRKLTHVMVGAEVMAQAFDYLNHDWAPLETSKRFEYSTSPVALASALETCIREVHLRYGVEAIRDEIYHLQDVFLQSIDRTKYRVVEFPEPHRSGILSMVGPQDPAALSRALGGHNVVCTVRGGYLRFAPHFYNTEDQIERVASLLNDIT